MSDFALSPEQIAQFHQQGFLRVPHVADPATCKRLLAIGQQQLADAIEPIEYEADTRYLGAPTSRLAEGGGTARRLLQMVARDPAFLAWATDPRLAKPLRQLLDSQQIALTQAHHNSLMTKQPAFSSVTRWHRDTRYWHFSSPRLVSAWLALGQEFVDNGCLGFLPESHGWDLPTDRFEAMAFLRSDVPENQQAIATAVFPALNPGDVVFFDANTFHAAGWNRTAATKFSLVFSYHSQDNRPVDGSRSARLPSIPLP
jgi:phytanoyl-CoA hydroxylase